MNKELIQLIEIICYRLNKGINGATAAYYELKVHAESRSPTEILSHVVDVSNYGLHMLDLPKSLKNEAHLVQQVMDNFELMKSHVSKTKVDMETSKKLIYGPLSDTLTHIGQLALLRRLDGTPIPHENFTKAKI